MATLNFVNILHFRTAAWEPYVFAGRREITKHGSRGLLFYRRFNTFSAKRACEGGRKKGQAGLQIQSGIRRSGVAVRATKHTDKWAFFLDLVSNRKHSMGLALVVVSSLLFTVLY